MTDDPFNFAKPGHVNSQRQPRPGDLLWEFRRADHHTFSCELRYHGEFGVEAQFLRDGDLLIGRRFDTKALAVQWANLERQDLEQGGGRIVDGAALRF
jgi:hypothetical protein